jgi:hypothetical protein
VQLRNRHVVSAAEPVAAVATPRALSLRTYLSIAGAAPVVIALTVLGVFLPVVIVPYAFSDDYSILWMAVSGEPGAYFGKNILDANAVGGRPVAGLLSTWFFSAAGTIDNLRFVRLVAVVGIAALALLLHWALVQSGIKPTIAALFAVLVCSLPAFQVYGSWAVLFDAPYAAILAGGASLVADAAVDAPRRLARRRIAGAFAMLLVALLMYQPAAMFFWVFLAVALIGAVRNMRRARRLAWTHFGLAAVALVVAFTATKLAVHLIGKGSPNAGRSSLTHDPLGKLGWFFRHPLYESLNLFDLTTSPWFAIFVAAIALAGILLLLDREGVNSLLYVGIAAVLIPLSFLPSLVVSGELNVYRVQVALSSLLALYLCLGALGIWLTARDWLQGRAGDRTLVGAERLALAVAVALVGTGAFVAARNVTTLVVEPQNTELRVLRSHVAALPLGAARIGFVQIGWNQGFATRLISDEFVPSSARPWTGEGAVPLILREEGRLPPQGQRPIVDIVPWNTTTLPENEPVVDLRGLQGLR